MLTVDDFRFSAPISLRWSDLDEFGHVNNAIYSTYLEEGRIAYFKNGIPWNWRVEKFLLARVEINFKRELKMEHDSYIYMRCSSFGKSSFVFDYLIVDKVRNIEIANARSVQVFIDTETGVPQALSTDIKQRFINFEGEGNITDSNAFKD